MVGNFHTLQDCAQVMQRQYMTNIDYTASSDKARSQSQTREYNPSESLVWFHLVMSCI